MVTNPSISIANEGAGGFHTVAFAYENSGESTKLKGMNAESEGSNFSPSFTVPDNLIQNLPPTEKVHQIIARTAKFVSEHGGQSEIVLRVKQGDNPTFGFLMPNHHLHAYFRFLVDHRELLSGNNSYQEDKVSTLEQNESGSGDNGALSLLGSLYGTGEDEESAQECTQKAKERVPEVTGSLQNIVPQGLGKTDLLLGVPAEKDLTKDLAFQEKVASKKSSNVGAGTLVNSKSVKKASEGSITHSGIGSMDKVQACDILKMPKPEAIILEPPSDMKKLIDKIVEFVQRNGKEVETVLREQDVKYGRFPFLVSSNLYHPYYLKILQKTQESSTTEKCAPGKDISVRHGKKTAGPKENDLLSMGSGELPFDANRKAKFTMVLGKSKEPVQISKAAEAPSENGMDATAIAAILQAATRGAKYPTLEFLSKTSNNGSSQNVDGQSFSTNGSWPRNSSQTHDHNELRTPSVPVAKYIAKTAALAAASEADSLEASMTKEQKLKAERLKRAKMFAAMIKGGGASVKTELLRGNSAERPEAGTSGLLCGLSVDQPEHGSFGLARGSSVERPTSGVSLLVHEVGVEPVKEREGSSIPPDVATSDENEKLEMKVYDEEYKERRSKRSYRSKSSKNDGSDDEVSVYEKSRKKQHFYESDEKTASDENAQEKDEGHARKKHKAHRHNHEKVDDDGGEGRSRTKHKSHKSSHDCKEKRRHSKEHSSKHHSRRERRQGHSSSVDDERDHRKSGQRTRKGRRSHAGGDLEKGEISIRSTDQSKASGFSTSENREASVERFALGPGETTADIPDELRAKVRAMLLANL
uniref:SURP motif domain-containing protein n=1 Tax=Kalanchoe fedtschenkoi TaxID=63787 RepID=A0A7N0VB26_KALFE